MQDLTQQPSQLNVAVGLIVRNAQVLIAWRDSSKHQGGRYEFSGGKVDAGESVPAALARELAEELGIQVQTCRFVRRLHYRYPEKTVCLHVYRVDQFSGEPHGAEGQPVKWVAPAELWQYQFPDANRPILRAAQLPDLYTISHDVSAFDTLEAWLDYHTQNVAPHAWLYVRVPTLAPDAQPALIQQLQQQRPDLKLVINAALYPLNLPVAGYHLRHADLAGYTVLPRHDERQLWFASVHDAASIQAADALGVDAMLLGAVLPTESHPEQIGMGWDRFAQLAGVSNCPVYALGGQSAATLATAQQYVGYGVAGIRGLLG
ncbi:MAG: Nudix family hydrolase [Moraxellaceae bacterium]